MCGLAGFWADRENGASSVALASAMVDQILHRGPDDHGTWCDAQAGYAIAHRRLAVVDLSPAGHQPMHSSDRRWVLAYNGEIYNHLELRRRLQTEHAAIEWRGHSDTETLLECIAAWGLETSLKRSVGMFALALWDRAERRLWLARDRMGEKPMYYGWQRGIFLFGSELKALRAHPAFHAEVDRGALALLLRDNYVAEPHSIYAGIFKLPPGTILCVESGQRDATSSSWWSMTETAERGQAETFAGSDGEALSALERHLGAAVRSQMAADVPLGALLSGGIDSSTIVALMQVSSTRRVRTFTIGFGEREYDESAHARAVAKHLGTEHSELHLSGADALALVPEMPTMYDEPFADSSQLPTHLVMKLARAHVTVALSGDAGDELFGGYKRYFRGPLAWQRMGWIPAPLRKSLGIILTRLPVAAVNRLGRSLAQRTGIGLLGDEAHKLGLQLRNVRNIDDLHVILVSQWQRPSEMIVDGCIASNLLDERERWPALHDPVARMMALDALTYLPGDILTKVDRASMAVSLETRAPFLDAGVIDFAWSLPMHMRLRDGQGKWLLRQLLYRHVPQTLVDRPKMGFSVPLDAWLRGPLRDWAETLLSKERLTQEGFFHPTPIRAAWQQHLAGEASMGHRLWSVLMFQAWLENQSAHSTTATI